MEDVDANRWAKLGLIAEWDFRRSAGGMRGGIDDDVRGAASPTGAVDGREGTGAVGGRAGGGSERDGWVCAVVVDAPGRGGSFGLDVDNDRRKPGSDVDARRWNGFAGAARMGDEAALTWRRICLAA